MSIHKISDPILEKVTMIIGNYRGIVTYENLVIEQNLLSHDTFSFLWRIGEIIPTFRSRAEFVSKYEGTKVLVTFKDSHRNEKVNFKGIITSMELIDKSNASGGYLVSGYSATVCIDDMPECQTYFNKSIEEITKIIDQRTNKAFFTGFHNDNKYKKQIPYIVQYNETDFEFLQRLCMQYGEWMYHDGDYLQIGNFKNSKAVLTNGVNLYDFHVKTKILSHKLGLKGYDPLSANPLQAKALEPQSNSQSHFTTNALRASRNNYNRKNPNFAYTSSAKNAEDMQRIQNLIQQAREAQATIYSGMAQIPLQIGGNVTILNDKVELKSIVTKILHWSKGTGHYQNNFEAIPADVKAPPYANPLFHPEAESQPATVSDNNDPQGMGRVKVKFFWGYESDWLRLIQPHSGAGKGFHFIPEIGEEVMVAFEDRNPENGYIMGTHYNGSETSSYHTSGNDKKVIHTRSGTKIILNDAEGSVFIEDPSGNTYLMDGQGNINVNAPNDMTFTAGKNVSITAGKEVSVSAGTNMINSANDNITQTAGTDIKQTAGGEIHESSDKRTEIADKEIKRQSEKSDTVADKIDIFSEKQNMTMQSGKMVENNSADKAKLF